ncbi:MAG: Na-translocating system protein MpsC family protein, partial [Candidatus Omnitrophota bacterium]|nr:Na-translocating system protein MpsC family protein [Candidatus Omnitrophota bacterium]
RMLAKKEEGMELIKELKEKLIEKIKPLLEQTIEELTGAKVDDVHSSFNPETGERVEVFTLSKDLK